MKKLIKSMTVLLSLCLVLALAVGADAATVQKTVSVGPEATGTLYDDGTFVVEGTGSITVSIPEAVPEEIRSVQIKEGITEVGTNAFWAHGTVRSIEVASSVTVIGDGAFGNNGELDTVILHEGLQSIGDGAFMNSYSLQQIIIPASVTSIQNDAFSGCTTLTEVILLGDAVTFADYVFPYAGGEAPLTIYYPDTGKWTQEDLKYLGRTVTWVPYTLDASGNRVPDESRAYVANFVPKTAGEFENGGNWWIDAAGVLHIAGTGAVRPDSGSDIHWDGITGLVVEDGVQYLQCGFRNYEDLRFVELPDTLTNCPEFFRCTALERVKLGAAITEINSYNFNYCPQIKEITIPESVTTIAESAFYRCKNLTSVTFLGDAPQEIGEYAFAKVGEVRLYYPANNATWQNEILDQAYGATAVWTPYTLDAAGNMVADYENSRSVAGVLRRWESDGITSTMYADGSVKVEGSGILYGNQDDELWNDMTRVEIGDGITAIAQGAFARCKVKQVDLGHGVKEIGKTAFQACESLERIQMPDSLTTIGVFAFDGCTNLKTVQLNEGLLYISDGAFSFCGITEITIPSTVLDLGYGHSGEPGDYATHGAFGDCHNLKSVEILSEKISVIPYACFCATALEKVVFPQSVEVIEGYAFGDAPLRSIVFSRSLKQIENFAFVTCDDLSNVVFTGEAPVLQGAPFFCSGIGPVAAYPQEYADTYSAEVLGHFSGHNPYTVDAEGNYCIQSRLSEKTVAAQVKELKALYPEGYPLDRYSVGVLNGTGLAGYGSQAFAYILSDALFGNQPVSVDTTVTFDEVKVGDILRLEEMSATVVVTEKKNTSVVVAQGDWKGKARGASGGTVHWGEVLTKAQVESADYRITRYDGKLFADLSVVAVNEPTFPAPPAEVPTEAQAQAYIRALQSSYPEGYPYTTEIHYETVADMTNLSMNPEGNGCSAFAYRVSDLLFGTAPMRENTDIKFESVMVGDILHYDPDPCDSLTHVVVVLEVYQDRLVTVEANYNASVHWGSVFMKDEVEAMMGHYTRYPEGTVPEERKEYGQTHVCREFDPWVVIKNADCTQDGEEQHACVECGKTQTRQIPALGHTGNPCEVCGKNTDTPAAVFGDANGDGAVNAKDAMLVLQYYTKKITEDKLDLTACDVDGNGVVNAKDAMLILQKYTKKITNFPVEAA